MSQEQVQVEFKEELMQLQMLQQNPQTMQDPNVQMQVKMLTEKVESRKSILVSEMMEEFMKEEKRITSQFDNDPIAKLKSRELDLQAKEHQRKKEESEARLNLDRMKSMMDQGFKEEKLDQNEELANLRADTSIEKTILSAQLKKDN